MDPYLKMYIAGMVNGAIAVLVFRFMFRVRKPKPVIGEFQRNAIQPGFYFCRGKCMGWYNLIVEVHGDSPFYKIRAWDRLHDALVVIGPDKIEEWGPRLEVPK